MLNASEIDGIIQVLEGREKPLDSFRIVNVSLALRTLSQGVPLADIVKNVIFQLERQIIDRVLVLSHGNKSEAARRLKIDYKTLYRKLKQQTDRPAGAESGLNES